MDSSHYIPILVLAVILTQHSMPSQSNENFYKEGFFISLENAKRLAKIANIAAIENEFSIACSLNILAGEEAIKSILLIIKHYHPDKEFEGFDKLFTRHTVKHDFLMEASDTLTPIVEIVYNEYGLLNYLSDMIQRLSPEIPEPDRTKLLNGARPFLELLKKYEKPGQENVNTEDAKAWWGKANLEKNRGLYVDIINSAWHDPKSFTRERYQESFRYTNTMINNADRMLDLLERSKVANEK